MAHNTLIRLVGDVTGISHVIPYAEWVDRLHESAKSFDKNSDWRRNPALRMLPFWRFMEDKVSSPGRDEMGFPIFTMKESLKVTTVLGEDTLPTTSEKDVKDWIKSWKRDGLIPYPATYPYVDRDTAEPGAVAKL